MKQSPSKQNNKANIIKSKCKCKCKWSWIYNKYSEYKDDIILTIKTIKCSDFCYCFNCCNWSRASLELLKWYVCIYNIICIQFIYFMHAFIYK